MPVFVDTSVLVYARDTTERAKQPRAEAWLEHLWNAGTGRLSIQVLQEYYVTVTRKLAPGLPREEARADVRDLLTWQPLAIDDELLETAWRAEERYGVSFWDALIVAAAQTSGCGHLLSEDLQAGMDFDGTIVVDPFATEPSSLTDD